MKRHSKTGNIAKTLLLALVLIMALSASGCGRQGHAYEPEITAEYLQSEYAEQLIRDGAEVVFGTLDVTGTVDGTPLEGTSEGGITLTQFTISAKEYVEDASAENGYYIADKNKAYITYAGDDTRVACGLTGDDTLQVYPIHQFANSYDESKYFDVYLIEDQVHLIIEHIF